MNTTISALNQFFAYNKMAIKLERVKTPKPSLPMKEDLLTTDEFERLLQAARQQDEERTALMLQVIYYLGVRIFELQYITVEAVRAGKVTLPSKGLSRTVIFPAPLRETLQEHAEQQGILSKSIFITSKGKPIHRKLVWQYMKRLCHTAQEPEDKVSPSNLRFVRAREYCQQYHDVAGLPGMLRVRV